MVRIHGREGGFSFFPSKRPDAPITQPPTPARRESLKTPDVFETSLNATKNTLREWGFGPAVEFLTPQGLDRKAYLSWTRGILLGPDYVNGIDGKKLPALLGEAPIPHNVQEYMGNMLFHDLYLNLGYGHLRPANSLSYLVELLGGTPKDTFVGGPENVFPEKDILNDRIVCALLRAYTRVSLRKALDQGMIDKMPELYDPDPQASQRLRRVLSLIKTGEAIATKRQKAKVIRDIWKDPDAVVADILAINENDSLGTMHWQAQIAKPIAGGWMGKVIKKYQDEYPDKDSYVFSTWTVLARFIGGYVRQMGQKPYTSGHFQPDFGIVLGGYAPHVQNYIESKETAEKWGYQLGLNGQPAPDTFALNGYVTPLSVFKRKELTLKRQEALKKGEPLTVIALGSGVAPVQLGVFKQFITNAEQEMKNGKVRMVVQCGAQEDPSLGLGLTVYEELDKLVKEKGLQNSVVLHVAKTPKAAVDFYEAALWSEKPIAVLVKGAEAFNMAHATNTPGIPTGTVGSHEMGNIANNVLHSPEMVTFPPSVGQQFMRNVQTLFPHDSLFQHHPDYIPQLVAHTKERTATNTQQLLDMTNAYIASGKMTDSAQDAMLILLSDMIARKHPETRRRTPAEQNLQAVAA